MSNSDPYSYSFTVPEQLHVDALSVDGDLLTISGCIRGSEARCPVCGEIEPVITIVDRGKLGGRPFAPHWAVVYGAGEAGVRLANTSGVSVVPHEQFMKAFRCSFMPASLRHCAIFVSS